MDNKIEIFKNEQFGEVRTILEGEKVLFCAADVAKALGYTNPNKAVNDHCRAITKRSTPISGKVQSINFIPEGDVYRLIIRSKLPAAEKFELWVFDEVIPTIRKTGGYMTDSLLERIQKEPAVIVEFAQALILEKNRVKALECELITAKPKADYYDAFINPDDCTNIRTTAKELKIPERKFVQFLLKEKYLFCEKELGIKFTILHADKTYDDVFHHVITRGPHKGEVRGFAWAGMCAVNRDCKIPPVRKYNAALSPDTVSYVGIAEDELKRLARLDGVKKVSLLAKYGMAEADAYKLCQEHGLLSPIYAHCRRNGCWFCPNASDSELLHMVTNYPEMFDRLIEWEKEDNIFHRRMTRRETPSEVKARLLSKSQTGFSSPKCK